MEPTPSEVDPQADTESAEDRIAGAGDDPDDPEAQRVLATLRRRLAHVHQPAKIDRFEVRRRIGMGGMGVVYAAWDPELRREVAIKLVQPGSGADPARLAREARALAELSHEHVVTVYASGLLDGGDLYIAMELVDGVTLDRWLSEQPRSLSAILDVFVGAARGLAAAHRLGLVHRDFKPSNVLVGADRRARVLDFGLVRRVDSEPQTDSDSGPAVRDDEQSLSRTGAILGTPAYMSIEQARGGKVDARADQFALCVALYEALAGTRPFPTETAEALIDAAEARRLLGRAAFRGGPAVLAVLVRGLSARPDDRFASMDALLHALARARRPRRVWMPVVAVAAAGAVAWAAWPASDAGAPGCGASSEELAEIWGAARRGAVHEALLSAQPSGSDAADRTLAVIDAWAGTWIETRDAVCADPQGEAFDRAMRCLAERRAGLAVLVEAIVVAPQSAAPQALLDAYHLPNAARCRDPGYLAARVRPPEDPALAAAVSVQEQRLSAVETLRASGKYEAALALAREIRGRAEELGYDPLQAEALHYSGTMLSKLQRLEDAAADLEAAYVIARRSGDDEEAVGAASELAYMLAFSQPHGDQALSWIRHAEAALDSGHLDVRTSAALADTRGSVLRATGDAEAALAAHREALARFDAAEGEEHPDLATYLHNIGTVLGDLGRLDEAIESLRGALAMREHVLGTHHPETALTTSNLGGILLMAGKLDEAQPLMERALALREALLPADHPDIAHALSNLGVLYANRGDMDRAIAAMQRAVTILQAAHGEESADVSGALVNLGTALTYANRAAEALPHLQRAVAIRRSLFGEQHPALAAGLASLGDALAATGRADEASAAFEEALAIGTATMGADHPELAAIRARAAQ